jgi:hypothetical protein
VLLVTTKSTVAKANPVAVYQQKLSNVLGAVVAANQALSVSLQALTGSKTTIGATKTATANAQQALTSASGAVAIITVPPASTQLSQQAKQALTQENGYLQSVNTTLGDPTGNTSASIQPLASATSSAFVPLASVAPGGSASIYGVNNLLSWAQGATNAQGRNTHATIINNNTTTTTTVTPPAIAASSSQGCGAGLQVNGSTSCPFAENVQQAYYSQVGQGDGTVTAYSPVTGQVYTMSCTQGDSHVCTGGNNAYVAW